MFPSGPCCFGLGVRVAAGRPALLGRPAAAGVRLAVAADFAALAAGGVRLLLAAAGTRLLAAARFLVDRRPGAALGLLAGGAAGRVALGDVLGLPLLLVA